MAEIGGYVLRQRLAGRKRFPLVLMLEPLFRCNLACAGCGKIDYPDEILNQRLPLADCLEAIDECGAPVVVVAGGEPLLHKDIGKIVRGALDRGKFVTLCTNALLLEKKMGEFTPSSAFNFSVHLDGDRDMHDKSVCQEGVYDRAVAVVTRDRKASTSYIQRRLQIGYNRAASLMERMEQEGIVGQANHAGKREILVGQDEHAKY